MTMRSQEREEQIELRRLRTENGLLLQRLARLEEESAVMADHLVKCQLIRAQEAEAAIALRCELAILRREYSLLNPSQNTNELLNGEAEDDINLIPNHRMIHNDGTQDTTATATTTSITTTTTMQGSIAKTVPTTDTADTTVTTTDASSNNTTNTKLTNGSNQLTHNPQDNSVHQQTITNGHHHPMNLGSPNYYSKVNFTMDSNHSPNSSYDFCTLPRSRNRDHSTNNNKANNNNGTGNYNGEAKTDQLLSTTINQLQTDLVNSRFNEADAKKVSHELRCKLHELEESKTDQSLRAAEQIAVLKDELFGAKLRETELVNQIEEFKRRFDDLDSLWQMHLGKCKGVNNDTKRASLWIGSLNSLDASEVNNKMKFSDRILETRFINQISSLKQKITDLTAQQELSDRRADRLDKRVTELLESRTAFQARERELTMELKQLEQKCADIEAKRKADGVMWRSREMELKAQLAERKQGYLQLEYQYESLLTSQRLQVATGSGSQSLDNHDLCMRRKSSLDCDKLLEYNSNTTISTGIGATSNVVSTATNGTPNNNNNSSSINGVNSSNNNNNSNKSFTLGSYLKFAQSTPHSTSLANSTASTPRVLNPDNSNNNDNNSSPSAYTVSSEVYSMWKDLPPSVMTESIGPLEDLCLIPDDPMITSVYINPSTSSTSSLSPTKEAEVAIAVANTTTVTLTTSPPPLTSSTSVTSSLSSSNSQNF
ncbi:unnamed protein product [Trichobilharzia szidati]|nr:unnamed protein product [Trichobilharzia szidati]